LNCQLSVVRCQWQGFTTDYEQLAVVEFGPATTAFREWDIHADWTNARLGSVDCTGVTVILRKRLDSLCFWAFRILSGLAKPVYAGPVYTGIISGVLQIPQYMAGKGIVRKIPRMPNKSLHLTFFRYSLTIRQPSFQFR